MDEKASRKDLVRGYKESPPDAGVYRVVSRVTGTFVVGTAMNLGAMENRVAFARTTNSVSALDLRLKAEALKHGVGSFEFEALERVAFKPGMTREEMAEELETLRGLWEERLAAGSETSS